MNKNFFSILIVTSALFAACKQSVKQESAPKNSDSLFHTHAKPGTKKLSCCVSPPSRRNIKSDKK